MPGFYFRKGKVNLAEWRIAPLHRQFFERRSRDILLERKLPW
jgi:hypothetical protein